MSYTQASPHGGVRYNEGVFRSLFLLKTPFVVEPFSRKLRLSRHEMVLFNDEEEVGKGTVQSDRANRLRPPTTRRRRHRCVRQQQTSA